MQGESQAKVPRDPFNTVLVIIAAVLVVAVGAVGYVMYDNSKASSSSSDVIADGDTVTLDYTGSFGNGRIFDTSLWSVAEDNATYEKSLTFALRENTSYTPFDMTAGLYGVSGGTIKGFALGVIGLKTGDHRTIEIAPADGYAVDETKLENWSVVEEVQATEVYSDADFRTLFGVEPVELQVVAHYKWQWDVLVMDVTAGVVTVKSTPTVGELVYPYGDPFSDTDPSGWACVVEAYDWDADTGIGTVTVRNDITAQDVYEVKGVTNDGVTFVVSGYDDANQTFQIHKSDATTGYNGEISGRTLYFEIWVVSVTKA